tara:strand:- start:2109 stop:2372 length:264 start_codon:yes stop_codon:yes gene_type:complete
MNFEYKISNQPPKKVGMNRHILCECCRTIIRDELIMTEMEHKNPEQERSFYIFYSYAGKEPFILTSKSGHSLCYCSEKCMKKHNHRF